MNLSRGYLQYFAIFSVLALCFIGQVSSRKCYACNSDTVSGCITGNLTKDYQVECNGTTGWKSSLFSGIADSLDKAQKTPIEYDCGYSKGVALLDGRTVVTRGCAPKYVTCDTVKILTVAQNIQDAVQIDTCKRCDSDNCNSSGHLKAGVWILTLALLMAYLFKY